MRRRMMMQLRAMEHDYSSDYLTFEAIDTGTFSLTIPANVGTNRLTSVSWSVDNGSTWNTTNNTSSTVTITTSQISAGSKVIWKGTGSAYAAAGSSSNSFSSSSFSRFQSTGRFNMSGNIMSLIYGDNFANQTVISAEYTFTFLFYQAKIVSLGNFIFGAKDLNRRTFGFTFSGCSYLTTLPKELSFTTAHGPWCCMGIFQNCTALTDASALNLPNTSLQGINTSDGHASGIYYMGFYGCTNLVTPPILPATTVCKDCYEYMFQNCSKLETAPVLKASTLYDYSYRGMFSGCTKLNYIKMLATSTSANSCLSGWVSGVASTGTFVKHPNASLSTGANGIPSNWTVQTATE